jgi:signal transduction histidine kinase
LKAFLKSRKISVRTWDEGDEVRVAIEDQGTGIEKKHLRRLFEPFFTTRGVGRGVGLGLTVAYGIVKRVAGEIDVASELGKGSTFTIRVPKF